MNFSALLEMYVLTFKKFKLCWSVITVAARYKAWNAFTRSNVGIVDSNSIQGIDICLRLFGVCVVLCRKRPYDGLIPQSRSPTDCA
jgi:hypothetical protein